MPGVRRLLWSRLRPSVAFRSGFLEALDKIRQHSRSLFNLLFSLMLSPVS